MDSHAYLISELRNSRLVLEDFLESGFDEPERALFDAAGKSAMFQQVRGQSAIFVARFRRIT